MAVCAAIWQDSASSPAAVCSKTKNSQVQQVPQASSGQVAQIGPVVKIHELRETIERGSERGHKQDVLTVGGISRA